MKWVCASGTKDILYFRRWIYASGNRNRKLHTLTLATPRDGSEVTQPVFCRNLEIVKSILKWIRIFLEQLIGDVLCGKSNRYYYMTSKRLFERPYVGFFPKSVHCVSKKRHPSYIGYNLIRCHPILSILGRNILQEIWNKHKCRENHISFRVFLLYRVKSSNDFYGIQ